MGLFPVNKPMKTIYTEYFEPWAQKVHGVPAAQLASLSTVKRARHDKDFANDKNRPKHYHAQCGVCYRLNQLKLRGFKSAKKKAKYHRLLEKHDACVKTWRATVAAVTNAARHDATDVVTLFYDDTGAVMLPHVTNRPLKDLPTGTCQLRRSCASRGMSKTMRAARTPTSTC